jgi:phytoene dehydrogenase-like protein
VSYDAVVIGAGPNGLVGANLLADRGWSVLVLEAQDEPGGAVKSAQLTQPGFVHDVFSAFYPLAAASPVIRTLGLERYGLEWAHSPLVLAHVTGGERCAVLSRDLDETAASLDAYAPGDGDSWRDLYKLWLRIEDALIGALFRPFPPIAPALQLLTSLRRDLLSFARLAVLPVRRMGEEYFAGEGGPLLLAGNALHTDLTPETAAGGFFGWLLTSLGQSFGYPAPKGGAGMLTEALVQRLEANGGKVQCGTRVKKIDVRNGTAVGVVTEGGDSVGARRAVLADTLAPTLYLELIDQAHLPDRVLKNVTRFEFDAATVKVDWALNGPIPWRAEDARGAGTVHLARSMDELSEMASQLARKLVPAHPFLVMGQMTTTDPTRSPAGTETAWAYSHVPREIEGDAGGDLKGTWDERETEMYVQRMENRIEEAAPGFKELIAGRHVLNPPALEGANESLLGGSLNGGTAQIHQQLIFRPVPGLARPETPIKNLYLASSSAHPGGGVHGAPGANAARVAVLHERARKALIAAGAAGALAGLKSLRR